MTAEPVEEERVEIPLDERTSYSAFSSYTYCSKQFQLERVVKVQRKPAWYFVAGSTLHEASEIVDRGEEVPSIRRMFLDAVEAEEEESGYPRDEWMSGGRASKAYPAAESERFWLDHLDEYLQGFVDWREQTGWGIWKTADGTPAIELPLEFSLGGLTVRGAIDRVYTLKNGDPVVVDLKSGSRVPSSLLQMGTYKVGLQLVHGLIPKWASYFMFRTKKSTPLGKLDKYNPGLLAELAEQYQRGIRAEVYLPNLGSHCMSCSVRPHCLMAGGGLAHESDPLSYFEAPF